jgi:hypothetical protein
MNDIATTIEEDILAMIPPVEIANARLDEFEEKVNAGLLTEGVDYEVVSWPPHVLAE